MDFFPQFARKLGWDDLFPLVECTRDPVEEQEADRRFSCSVGCKTLGGGGEITPPKPQAQLHGNLDSFSKRLELRAKGSNLTIRMGHPSPRLPHLTLFLGHFPGVISWN